MGSFFDTLSGKPSPEDDGDVADALSTEAPPLDVKTDTSAPARAQFAVARVGGANSAKKKDVRTNDSDSDDGSEPAAEPAAVPAAAPGEPEGKLAIDVYHTDDEVIVRSTIAGVDADDLNVSVTEDTVTIRGRRREGQEVNDERFYYRELYWGAFSRTIILPVEVNPDEAKASLKDGVLTVHIPKASRSKERRVSVKKT